MERRSGNRSWVLALVRPFLPFFSSSCLGVLVVKTPMTRWLLPIVLLLLPGRAGADVGDPQVRTDHPWYPGELACSTFPRLFATEAEVYRRVTGVTPVTDEQKALASW